MTSKTNFITIGLWVSEISQFCSFFMATILGFKILKFYCLTMSRTLGCTALPNTVKIGQSIAEIIKIFRFLNTAAGAILDFKILNFYLHMMSWGSSCITVPNFAKIGRRAFDIGFLIFQDGRRRHLEFQKFSNFLTEEVPRNELHHRAIIHQSPLLHCGDIAVFLLFFKWRPFAILNLFGIYLGLPQRVRTKL